MKQLELRAVVASVATMAVVSAFACQKEPAHERLAAVSPSSLFGQVLLPPGVGSRGVEVVITTTDAGNSPRKTWLIFDEDGRFQHNLSGHPTALTVSTGIRSELYRIVADDLPAADREGRIDVGAIDLRNSLRRHRLALRAAEGAPDGDVRVAMCFGSPPVGPSGEPISLGSRQFPPVALGSETEWLLPHEATDIHYLVERPVGSGDGREWRGGHQRLFGPFTMATLPTELVMD